MVKDGYTWRTGFPTKADANAFAAQLEELRDEQGIIHVDAVVEASKAKGAPLHGEIDWDDESAARKFRLNLVTDYMGALRVVPVDVVREEPLPPLRALVPARRLSENGVTSSYMFTVNVVDAVAEPEIETRMRVQALDNIRALARRLAAMPGCKDLAEQLLSICELA